MSCLLFILCFCVFMSVPTANNRAHAATDLHMGVHNIRSYLRLQIGLMLIGLSIVLLFPVCIFCLEGRVCSHDQCEEKKQIPHWQCGGSVWWELHVTVRDLITNNSECIMCCLFFSQTCLSLPCFSHFVQLFSGATGLQPLPYCRPQVWLRLVWQQYWLSLCVPGFLQWWGPAHLSCTRHSLCKNFLIWFWTVSYSYLTFF